MPAYKRQHFLPAAYLKYFSVDQTNCSRNSWIWRCGAGGQQQVRVESQCRADYHYSKKDPASTEQEFQKSETFYCICIDKIKQGQQLTDIEGGNLLVNMFDFYIRNAVHRNETGKEGIDAYRIRQNMFWNVMLVKMNGVVSKRDIQEHIYQYWRLAFVRAKPPKVFIASDHPSAWTSINDDQPGLHLLTLPLTPALTAVAADRRLLEVIRGETTVEDCLTLNDAQIQNSVSSLYGSAAFGGNEVKEIMSHFSTKSDPDCKVDSANWRLKIIGLRPEHYFSFVRPTPPVL
jgi:hypothetical protein